MIVFFGEMKKVLNFLLQTYPNLTKPNHFAQSSVLYALRLLGCQDYSSPTLEGF